MMNTKTTPKNGLGYEGTVKLKIVNYNEVIKELTVHNNGREPLFRFFAYCLCGNFTDASANYPQKIALFKCADATNDVNTKPFNSNYWADEFMLTPSTGIFQDSIPELIVNDDGTFSTKLHFRVPLTLVSTPDKIYKIGLYTGNPIPTNPSAYIYFANTELFRDVNSETVLIIEWIMTMSNKND